MLVISQAACQPNQRAGSTVATLCSNVKAPVGRVDLTLGMPFDSICLVVDRSMTAVDTAVGLEEFIGKASRDSITRIEIGEKLIPLRTSETTVDTTVYWEVVLTYAGERAVAAWVNKVTGDVEHLGVSDRILDPGAAPRR